MKTLYLTLALCVTFAGPSFAQIVLKDNHHPEVGSSFETRFGEASQGNFDLAKSDVTEWDLRTLKLSNNKAEQVFVAPGDTKYSSQFDKATLAMGSPAGATNGIYNYYDVNQKQLEYHGYISSVYTLDGTLTYPVVFDKPMATLKFPLNYKDSFHASASYTSTTLRVFGEEGEIDSVFGRLSRITEVDAYGTLVMPDNSVHEVLRLHIQESKFDSIVSDTGYRISSYDNSWFEYHSPEYAQPLVIAYMSAGDVEVVGALDPSKSTKIVGLSPIVTNQITLYPNPAGNTIRIESENAASVDIFNLNAQLVTNIQVINEENIDISSLPNGVFTAILRDSADKVLGRSRLIKMSH